MPDLPLHPAFVHLPLALAAVVPCLALVLLISWRCGWLPQRSLWLAVGLQVVLIASAFAALRSGEAEEETAETVLSHEAIEAHEEAAERFVWVSVPVLVLLGLSGGLRRATVAQGCLALACLAAMAAFALAWKTGELGAKLVYQHGAAAPYVQQAASSK
ncbi:MAG: DUF2231 domain-containing protein [Polyangiales bacterium]